MKEHQHIEWKREWDDEHLKWLCAFANADGGSLSIGVDDEGKEMELSADPLLGELKEELGAYRIGEEIADTKAVEKLLAREDIFSTDLTKCGDLAERIITIYKKLMQGAGALRRELHALVAD